MRYTLELHPDFAKEYKKLKLDNKQKTKVKEDLKDLCNTTKKGKQLINEAFPLFEIKYRSWGFRIFYVIQDERLILLSCGRKKDDVVKSLKKAINRKD